MADTPYLVALALVESEGTRALPLGGQSWRGAAESDEPGELGRNLALELLLRVWQRSDGSPLQRAAADDSLLLLEMPLAEMSEQLPRLKAAWLAGGSTEQLQTALRTLASRAWQLTFSREEGVRFSPLP